MVGCGGGSEEDGVKQAFDDYVQAVKDGDGDGFCDSIASSESLEMSADERAKDIELCKAEFSGDTDEFDDVSWLARRQRDRGGHGEGQSGHGRVDRRGHR